MKTAIAQYQANPLIITTPPPTSMTVIPSTIKSHCLKSVFIELQHPFKAKNAPTRAGAFCVEMTYFILSKFFCKICQSFMPAVLL